MINYTYTDFVLDVNILVGKITKTKKYQTGVYNGLYPIVRGGVPLALVLSDRLKLPIINKFDTKKELKGLLIVDEIVDSGYTRNLFINNDFVCLHVRDHTDKKLYPTFYVEVVNEWVYYWWENE